MIQKEFLQDILKLYVNFDDPRLYDFELSDFQKLDVLIKESGKQVLMFDENRFAFRWMPITGSVSLPD